MNNYKDEVDIIMTALTEMSMHVDDEHYSEIKSKIAIASYGLGHLTATCHALEHKAHKPVQLNAKLKASHDKQRLYIGDLKRELFKLQERDNKWTIYCSEQEAKIEDLETAREQLNSSVKYGRKIMKRIGKHK